MTADRRRKRRVRARAAKTGESYTAALRHLQRTEEPHMSTYNINPAGVTDIGNVRVANEDTFVSEGDLFAVADGMGGRGNGELASALAVKTLQDSFSTDRSVSGLVEAVGEANRAVWERAQTSPELHGMGTTIAAVARLGGPDRDRLVIVNVGDSRVYLLRDAELERLTNDHSRVADLVRAGEITEHDAADHPERHILTHALGVESTVVPNVTHTVPVAGDRLLLCSDGLFNEVPTAEIAAILGSEPDAAKAVERLVTAAKDHGGSDNITAVVLDIG